MVKPSESTLHAIHAPIVKKRYARIRGQQRILDVREHREWELMRSAPKPPLVCPVDGCRQAMHTVLNTNGTRFLRNGGTTEEAGCTHLVPPTGGGGPMTEEHLWLQMTMFNLCLEMGYDARLETDYADIRVESNPPFALEVQLRGTDIDKRAAQRAERKMRTLWLFPETARSDVDDPLFTRPAVRVKYMREGDPTLPPWDPQSRGSTTLKFGATIWKRGDDPTRFARAGSRSPKEFLREVFENRRHWYRRDTLHESSDPRTLWAGWALEGDLDDVRAARDSRDRAAAAERAIVETAHSEALHEHEERHRRTRLQELLRTAHADARRRLDERYWHAEQKAKIDAAHRDALREDYERGLANAVAPGPSSTQPLAERPGLLRRLRTTLTLRI